MRRLARVIEEPRRGYWLVQYSLRTALVVFLVSSLFMARLVNLAARQERGVRAVERLGGVAHFDYQCDARGTPQARSALPTGWLSAWLGDHFVHNIVSVSLYGRPIRDDQLSLLVDLPRLKALDLGGTEVGNEGMDHLVRLTNLDNLSLAYTLVTEEGLRQLAALRRLGSLNIEGINVSDAEVRNLSHELSGVTIVH